MSLRHLPNPAHRKRARRLLGAAYAAFLTGGALVLAIPPRTIEGALGVPLHWLWALMVLVGGLAGAWGVMRTDWRPERWTTYLVGTGLVVYAGTLGWLSYDSDSWGRIGLTFLTLGAALLVFYRGVEVEARAQADRDEHDTITRQE